MPQLYRCTWKINKNWLADPPANTQPEFSQHICPHRELVATLFTWKQWTGEQNNQQAWQVNQTPPSEVIPQRNQGLIYCNAVKPYLYKMVLEKACETIIRLQGLRKLVDWLHWPTHQSKTGQIPCRSGFSKCFNQKKGCFKRFILQWFKTNSPTCNSSNREFEWFRWDNFPTLFLGVVVFWLTR